MRHLLKVRNLPEVDLPSTPEFPVRKGYQAEKVCRASVGDPWLFGYFIDNELAWWGRGDHETGLFDAVMRKPAEHTAKLALRDFLVERYRRDLPAFTRAWLPRSTPCCSNQ